MDYFFSPRPTSKEKSEGHIVSNVKEKIIVPRRILRHSIGGKELYYSWALNDYL